jgi:DNA-3-methyladenine glycosylase
VKASQRIPPEPSDILHKPSRYRLLRRSELPSDSMAMARFLIGKILVRDHPDGRTSGRIVETEAYPPGDASSHAFKGETPARRSMFLRPGHGYVYMAYGSCFCFNVSSEPAGIGGGILIRALEPLEGIDLMQRRRGTEKVRDLARGPGRLAAAMAIDRALDGIALCEKGPLWLATSALPTGAIATSVRIGISREAHHLRRFHERGSPHVSGTKRLNTR